MKTQDIPINNNSSSYLSSLPKPSLTQAINMYHAYNTFGPGYTGALACTSLGDGFLSTQFEGRNYLCLSAFWVNIAYKAVSQVQNSSQVPPAYKIPLNLLFASIAAGMVWKGKDIFEDKHDLAKTVKAVKLTTGFFDEEGIMSELFNEFDEGYFKGITYVVKNAPSLATNKFVSYTFLGQVLHFTNSYLIQKIFNNMPQTGQLAIFLQLKICS